MARWGISNYNAFVREAKREFGLSHIEAQQYYRDVRQTLDRPVFKVDLKRHREDIPKPGEKEKEPERYPETLSDYYDLLDMYEEFEDIEYDSSADYPSHGSST
jgi:hypothetical protein